MYKLKRLFRQRNYDQPSSLFEDIAIWLITAGCFLGVYLSIYRFKNFGESDTVAVVTLLITVMVGLFVTETSKNRLLKSLPLGVLICTLVAGVVFFGCKYTAVCRFVTANRVIKIGVTLPSGDKKSDGVPIREAVDLAVTKWSEENKDQSDIFSNGKYVISVWEKDYSGNETKHGIVDLKAFISDAQVAGVIGPFDSDVALGQIGITPQDIYSSEMPKDMRIVLMSPTATAVCLTQQRGCQNDNGGVVSFFRTATSSDYQAHYLLRWLFENGYQDKKFVVITDGGVYGSDLANQFRNQLPPKDVVTINGNGVTVLNTKKKAIQDIEKELKAIVSTKPDVIFYAGTTPNIKDLYAKLLTSGSDQTFSKVTLPAFLQKTVFAAGGAVRNSLGTQTLTEDDNFQRFKDIYVVAPVKSGPDIESDPDLRELKKDDQLNLYSSAAYTSTRLVLDAIKAVVDGGMTPPGSSDDLDTAKKFRAAVIQKIKETQNDDVNKPYFDSNGDITQGFVSIHQFNKQFDKYKNNDNEWDFKANYEVGQ